MQGSLARSPAPRTAPARRRGARAPPLHAAQPLLSPPRRGRRRAMRVAADLWAAADTIITSGAIAVGVGAALLAVFADRLPPAKLKEQQDGSFRWGIMGAVSCLPLFNWLVRGRCEGAEELGPHGASREAPGARAAGRRGRLAAARAGRKWSAAWMRAALRGRALAAEYKVFTTTKAGREAFSPSAIPCPFPPGPRPHPPKPAPTHLRPPTRHHTRRGPQAWVFAALEDEERARLYYWFAALYALPLLRNGFDFDGFSVAMLLVGVAHVQVGGCLGAKLAKRCCLRTLRSKQPALLSSRRRRAPRAADTPLPGPSAPPPQAERIANTEPESQAAVARALSPLSVLKTAARAARAAAGALFGGAPSSRGAGRLPAGGAGARGWGERVQGEQEGEVEFEKKFEKTRSQELEEKYRADELADFDRRLRERDAEARRGGRR